MIAAAVSDLMDRSRFAGLDVSFVDRASEARDAELVIVDLDRCADVTGFGALPGRTVGFGSHVDAGALAAAESAGFDEVMARSVFFRRLREIVGATPAAGIDPTAG